MKTAIRLGSAAALFFAVAAPSYATWSDASIWVEPGQTAYCQSAGSSTYRLARVKVKTWVATPGTCEPELSSCNSNVPPPTFTYYSPEAKNVTANGKKADLAIRSSDANGYVLRSLHDNVKDGSTASMSSVYGAFPYWVRGRCNVAPETEMVW